MTRFLAALAVLALAGCQTVTVDCATDCPDVLVLVIEQDRGGNSPSGQATVPMSILP